jgi:hypothetical protein
MNNWCTLRANDRMCGAITLFLQRRHEHQIERNIHIKIVYHHLSGYKNKSNYYFILTLLLIPISIYPIYIVVLWCGIS